METIISEGQGKYKLTFKFSDKWAVYKYDESVSDNFYNKLRHQGLKAVDFIAISENSILIIEVKYVLSNNEISKIRLTPQDESGAQLIQQIKAKLTNEEKLAVSITSKRPYLVDEVDKKLKDTLLGLFASYRNNDSKLSSFNKHIFTYNKPIILIVFLERTPELNKPDIFKPMVTDLKIAIERKLGFLGNFKVDILNTLTIPPELGIEVFASDEE
jgi:hypothetical protein